MYLEGIEFRLPASETLKELGFRKILNAAGHYTVKGGSCPSKEVLQCMKEASQYWIDLTELEISVGAPLKRYIGCEDGIVTSGAYTSNIIATAASLAIARSKNSSPLTEPNVVIQKSHVTKYAQSFTTSGVRLKEIQRKNDGKNDTLTDYIDKSTIALTYVLNESEHEFNLQETVEAGKKSGLPVIVDAAIVDPPIRGLKEILRYNPDFVTVSGGKGFNGPSASGLLVGKRDLIAQARELAFPNYGPGRSMKVGREQIAGLIEAVRLASEANEDLKIEQWKENIQKVERMVRDLSGIRTEVIFPWRLNFPQPVPRLYITIERPDGVDIAKKIRDALMTQSNPPIFTRPLDQIEGGKNKIVLEGRVLAKKEIKEVAEQLRFVIQKYL